MSETSAAPTIVPEITVAQERRERLAQLLASPTFLIGLAIVAFWSACAIFGVVTTAPSGAPFPIPFAMQTMSGITSCVSNPQ